MAEILDKLSEHIIVGTSKPQKATEAEVIDLISMLNANKIDESLTILANLSLDLLTESDQNAVSVAYVSIKRHLSENYDVIDELTVKRRKRRRRPNSKLSRIAKQRYKRNKNKIKKGLAKFRKSAKGKQFYKALGKYNSRRRKSKKEVNEATGNTSLEILELAITINSALSQFFIHLKDNFTDYISIDSNSKGLKIEEIQEIIEVVSASLQDLFDVLYSGDPELIEDTLDEVIGTVVNMFTEYENEFEEENVSI